MKKEDNSVIILLQNFLMNSKVLTLDPVRYSQLFTQIETKGLTVYYSKVTLNLSISQDRKIHSLEIDPSVINRKEEKLEEMNKAKKMKDSDMQI